MRLGAIVRRRIAATWLRRLTVALSVPTFGFAGVGCASLLATAGAIAIARSVGIDPAWEDASMVAGMLVGLASAAALGRSAARSWDAAGRLLESTGALAIGADGVRWASGDDERFVPWSEVERVEEEPTLDDELGTLVVVGTAGELARLFVEDSEDLARTARAALEAYRTADADPLVDLEPNGRDVSTWIEDTKRLLDTGSYRAAKVRPERLVTIAATPAAPRAQRLGAAISLAGAPEPLRTQVRVALIDTADAELREVMEDAIEGRALDPRLVERAITARS